MVFLALYLTFYLTLQPSLSFTNLVSFFSISLSYLFFISFLISVFLYLYIPLQPSIFYTFSLSQFLLYFLLSQALYLSFSVLLPNINSYLSLSPPLSFPLCLSLFLLVCLSLSYLFSFTFLLFVFLYLCISFSNSLFLNHLSPSPSLSFTISFLRGRLSYSIWEVERAVWGCGI